MVSVPTSQNRMPVMRDLMNMNMNSGSGFGKGRRGDGTNGTDGTDGTYVAGEGGFEPPSVGSKDRCLTTWRLPINRLAGSSTKRGRVLFLFFRDRAHLRVCGAEVVRRGEDQLCAADPGGDRDYIEKLDRFIGEHGVGLLRRE